MGKYLDLISHHTNRLSLKLAGCSCKPTLCPANFRMEDPSALIQEQSGTE